jgi:hypothetical protein
MVKTTGDPSQEVIDSVNFNGYRTSGTSTGNGLMDNVNVTNPAHTFSACVRTPSLAEKSAGRLTGANWFTRCRFLNMHEHVLDVLVKTSVLRGVCYPLNAYQSAKQITLMSRKYPSLDGLHLLVNNIYL